MGTSAGSGEPEPSRGGQRQKRAARRQAIDILYQADVTARGAGDVIEEWRGAGMHIVPDAEELVRGVVDRARDIDGMLGASRSGWTLPRMAPLDRTILRVACYELLTGVPIAVAINEAVEMAKELSTDESGRFVNGVLGGVARELDDDPIRRARR